MANSNQKIYTLALGKCTGEFVIAYDFSQSFPSSDGAVTITEITRIGTVNNTFHQDSGTRENLENLDDFRTVVFTNHFSYPINVTINFCSLGTISQLVQPNESKTFDPPNNYCSVYQLSWQPVNQSLKELQTNPVAGSIAVIWDNVTLNSGDTTGAGSLILAKDKEKPTTGQLIITAPPGAYWSVYLDCPSCVEILDSGSGSGSESEESGGGGEEESNSDVEGSGPGGPTESGVDNGSESECCKVTAPPDAGIVLNPYEYMLFWKTIVGGQMDIEMAPKCPDTGRFAQKIGMAQSTGACCGESIEGGWVCLGDASYGFTQSECDARGGSPSRTRWIPDANCSACDSINGGGNNNGNGNKCKECTGGDPEGSRVHIVNITPEQVEQYWKDLIDSCEGTAYGPFPLMAKPSDASVLGKEATGLDAGGNDIQDYFDRDRRSYCPVKQTPKFGPVYMIGSDGNCGCVPIPMKYVICNGCFIGFGANACPAGEESDCPESDSDSGSDTPYIPPPPALPPEQNIGGLGGRGNFVPFNPPVPPVGGPGPGGPPQGFNPGVPRDINGRVGRGNPNQRLGSQQLNMCDKMVALAAFTGSVTECVCKFKEIRIECIVNGVKKAEKIITEPGVGKVLDWTAELSLSVADNGQYWFRWFLTPKDGTCDKPINGESVHAAINIIQEIVQVKCKTCSVEKLIERYCDGSTAEPIPADINGEEVCRQHYATLHVVSDQEDPFSSSQLQDSCGNPVTFTQIKREHKPVGTTDQGSYGSEGFHPSGCATYDLTYVVKSIVPTIDEPTVPITLPVRGTINVLQSGNGTNVTLDGSEYDAQVQTDLEQNGCMAYMDAPPYLPPSDPAQAAPIQRMVMENGKLKDLTVVGSLNGSLTFHPGTEFMDENGHPVTCDFNFAFIPDPTPQFAYQDAGGWFYDGPGATSRAGRTAAAGAIYRTQEGSTWDHLGVTSVPVNIGPAPALDGNPDCVEVAVKNWFPPADFRMPILGNIADVAAAVSNRTIDLYKLNRSIGRWSTMGGLSVNPQTGEFNAQIQTASTWNIDTNTNEICQMLLVYPPAELLKSRNVTDMGDLSGAGLAAGVGGQSQSQLKGLRQFNVMPGIGIRFKATNSDIIGPPVDTIDYKWPQIFINWPKRDLNGNVVKYVFEFYDPNGSSRQSEAELSGLSSDQLTILSGVPAPPGNPNAPAVCGTTYENPEPGSTPLCVLNSCGDSLCKLKRISKQYKGGGLGGTR